jgi:transcriptional regulator with XRE-family HTH domain
MPGRKAKVFGEWLDITLSNQGIMGRTLAEKVGVHDSAVSRWRAGNGVPNMDTCERIAEALGVDALRLAVTAGLLSQKVANALPFDVPMPTERRESVRRQLKRIRGVTDETRNRLLQVYEDTILEDGNDD